VLLSLALLLGASPCRASPEAADATRQHLYAGTLAAGIAELERRVAAAPADKEARFGLGMLHFARAVEHLGQGFYRHGLQPPHSVTLPLLRLPVPVNPDPEPLTYEDFRAIVQTFADDLSRAPRRHSARSAAMTWRWWSISCEYAWTCGRTAIPARVKRWRGSWLRFPKPRQSRPRRRLPWR
jgi:hypothetical protein